MISYEEACQIVSSAQKFGICLGLERMEAMLVSLDHPEQKINAIHLAGTNGKGSTLTYLKSIFIEAGYNVGTFTSPAIIRVNDKIQLNGEEIPDQEFALLIDQIKPTIAKLSETKLGAPTEFEILTAVAFLYFARKKPDIVLLETGLGGRLDSTNVIKPLVSIITNIGHDHMDILGNTIGEVAKEKAGIIKGGIPVVSGCKQKEAKLVIEEVAAQKSAPLYQLEKDFYCKNSGKYFTYESNNDHQLLKLKTGMLGTHQQENASLAIRSIEFLTAQSHFTIEDTHIRQGLINAKIPNRIEVIQEEPTIILDGGHNPEGMAALASTLATSFANRKISVLFCAMKDKDITGMLKPLDAVASEIILTSFSYSRAMDPHQVFQELLLSNCHVVLDWQKAYASLRNNLAKDDVLVITGSLYFLTDVRKQLNI